VGVNQNAPLWPLGTKTLARSVHTPPATPTSLTTSVKGWMTRECGGENDWMSLTLAVRLASSFHPAQPSYSTMLLPFA
jgi:hypothetical protein